MNISITICEMNQPALLNIGLIACFRKGPVELEFAAKKLHKLTVEKKAKVTMSLTLTAK